MIDDTILDKIRKVQGYLQSDNPNEAAVAAAKLSEMLLRYNLTLADIPSEQRKEDPFFHNRTDTTKMRLDEWRVTLAGAIARANLCRIIITSPSITWLGRESNVQVAEFIYATCSADLLRIADVMWYSILDMFKGDPNISLPHGKTWKHQFMMGAAQGVKDKLRAETERLRTETDINALIVVNDRELARYVDSIFPSLRSRAQHFTASTGAYGLGVQAGRNVSFKTGVGAGGSSAQKRIGG